MKNNRYLFIACLVTFVILICGCGKLASIKGSVSGTVYREGRPMFGQIQIVNPKTMGTLKTEPVNNAGHFIIPDVPSGEWLLAFLSPTAAPIGEYMYVKVAAGRPVTNLSFDITQKDPKVQELLDKIKAEKETGGTGGTSGTSKTGQGK